MCFAEVTYPVVPLPHRMDDIQLCKDIMDLKQELQNLVAIPGNVNDCILSLPRAPHLPSVFMGLGGVRLLSFFLVVAP